MKKQRAAPDIKPLRPVRELAAMVKRLPREERLRLEGIITGLDMAATSSKAQEPTSSPQAQ